MNKVILKSVLVLLLLLSLSCSKDKKKIKVGAILSLTGSGYVTGENAKNALELLEENVNKNGGIKGRDLEISFYDSETSLSKANELFDKVEKEEKPLFYISTLSFVSVGLAKKAEKYSVPLIGVSVSSDEFTKQNKWCVRLSPSNETQVNPMINSIIEHNLNNLALVIVDDVFGQGYLKLIEEKADQLNINYKYFPYTHQNIELKEFNSEMNNFDGIIIIGFTPQVKKVVSYIKAKNYRGKILGTSNMTNPDIMNDLVGFETFISAPTIYNKNYIFAKGIKNKYEQKFGKELNHFGATAYDVVNLTLEKLEDIEPKRALLIEKLREEYIYTGLLGIIASEPDSGEISYNMEHASIKDGKIEF